MFRPAARFLIAPRPPDFLAARFLAAVILPPLLFFAILKSPPLRDYSQTLMLEAARTDDCPLWNNLGGSPYGKQTSKCPSLRSFHSMRLPRPTAASTRAPRPR